MKTAKPISDFATIFAGMFALIPGAFASSQTPSFEKLAKDCAPNVHVDTLKALITVESSGNPYAIGVVNGVLERQPKNLPEAVSTARRLEKEGFNFSMGLSQVNRHNLAKYGETYASIFEPCRNLKTGAAILTDCFKRALVKEKDNQTALRAALSCYYSGNFSRGFRPDAPGRPSYVQKVVSASAKDEQPFIPKISTQDSDQQALTVRHTESNEKRKGGDGSSNPWVIFNQKTANPDVNKRTPDPTLARSSPVNVVPTNSTRTQEVPFVQFWE